MPMLTESELEVLLGIIEKTRRLGRGCRNLMTTLSDEEPLTPRLSARGPIQRSRLAMPVGTR